MLRPPKWHSKLESQSQATNRSQAMPYLFHDVVVSELLSVDAMVHEELLASINARFSDGVGFARGAPFGWSLAASATSQDSPKRMTAVRR